MTWDGGWLDGVRIEENTVEWDAGNLPAVVNKEVELRGRGKLVMERNTIRRERIREVTAQAGTWKLVLSAPPGEDRGRGGMVILRAAKARYGENRLKTEVVKGRLSMMLVGPDGREAKRWEGIPAPGEVGLAVRGAMGE
jgi:hypothetical protein